MKPSTFETLNGLRGVAACVVMLYHFPFGHVLGLDMGFEAVDLFFVLSGFVIATSYDQRIADGMGLWQFTRMRVARLYPLYVLGIVLGATIKILPLLGGSEPVEKILNLILNAIYPLLMLPTPPPTSSWENVPLYPLNDPSWSLFFELFINLIYVVVYRALTTLRIFSIIAMCLICFACINAVTGTLYGSGGWEWSNIQFGFLRVTYAFYVGVAIKRIHPMLSRSSSPVCLVAIILFLAMISLSNPAFVYFSILIGMPAVVVLAVMFEPTATFAPAFKFAGVISYPIYVIHKPMHALLAAMAAQVSSFINQAAADFMISFLIIAAAFWLDRHYDQPLRRYMMHRARGRCGPTQASSHSQKDGASSAVC